MKKLAVALLAVAVCIAAGFLMLDNLLERGTRLALEGMVDRCRKLGLDVTEADFEEVEADLPFGVRWNKCVVGIAPAGIDNVPVHRVGSIRIEEARLRIESILDRSFVFDARGIKASLGQWRGDERFTGPVRDTVVTGERARLVFRVSAFRPGALVAGLEYALAELEKLLTEGESGLPVTFSGIVSFSVGDRPLEVRIRVVRGQERSLLVMDEDDILAVSRTFDLKQPLTLAETRILARHPLKTPRLMGIRAYARMESKRVHQRMKRIPEDAYRHVLWSYLIAKEYGSAFAMSVTGAHEWGKGAALSNDSRMDLRNNEMGVKYAESGVPESSLPVLVMTDSNIVRSPASLD